MIQFINTKPQLVPHTRTAPHIIQLQSPQSVPRPASGPHTMALSDRVTLWILGFCASGTLVTLTLAQSVRGERVQRVNALNKKVE